MSLQFRLIIFALFLSFASIFVILRVFDALSTRSLSVFAILGVPDPSIFTIFDEFRENRENREGRESEFSKTESRAR